MRNIPLLFRLKKEFPMHRYSYYVLIRVYWFLDNLEHRLRSWGIITKEPEILEAWGSMWTKRELWKFTAVYMNELDYVRYINLPFNTVITIYDERNVSIVYGPRNRRKELWLI